PQTQLLRLNLERARILPGNPRMRHILVDAAGARLWLYENGRVRDTMKVVVGQPTQQTPMMAGLVRYAIANPYWYVPSDLAARRIAPNVLSGGPAYLRARRYEILSDWSANAKVVPPAKVNWRAVADGKQQLAMRQLPGGDNAMGKVKFMFPNDLGIYLHDTPDKQLFGKSERHLSNGCVRVEDYQRLAKWLMGKPLPVKGKKPEQQINLAEPVPIYITYLTAAPEEKRIAYHPDVYNRDLAQVGLAGLGGGGK
ncbi:MAG TPA: L,D-transpeptidase family protein, partial [Allosphingosinicella sp.]|nr:L,D-transpeptidase family protein [Allosphingosinicella sp.]